MSNIVQEVNERLNDISPQAKVVPMNRHVRRVLESGKKPKKSWLEGLVSIQELAEQIKDQLVVKEGLVGELPTFTMLKVKNLFTGLSWQRLLELSFLVSIEEVKGRLLDPVKVYLRPANKYRPCDVYVLVDGQHKAVLVWLARAILDVEGDIIIPTQLIRHDPDLSDDECKIIETETFLESNTQKRKVTGIDVVRALLQLQGRTEESKEAIKMVEQWKGIGIHVAGLGDIDGPMVNNHTRVTSSLESFGGNTGKAVRLLKETYTGDLKGSLIKSLAAVLDFADNAEGIGKVKRNSIMTFLRDKRLSVKTQNKWITGVSGNDDYKKIATRIIVAHNEWVAHKKLDNPNGDFAKISDEMLMKHKIYSI